MSGIFARCSISTHALREEGDCNVFDINLNPLDFYPRPPRGGRRILGDLAPLQLVISTHALREEGDDLDTLQHIGLTDFYPRPPRGGRHRAWGTGTTHRYFYPRPPRGGRLQAAVLNCIAQLISTHALREEGDSA